MLYHAIQATVALRYATMTFSDFCTFLFFLAIIGILLVLTFASDCWPVTVPLLFVMFMMTMGWLLSPPPGPPNLQFFTIWNHSTRETPKAGRQITSYRHPNSQLSAQEYLMGVEMAKSNACHSFNFQKESDIAHFRRCAHFFPELYAEYARDHQARVGVAL